MEAKLHKAPFLREQGVDGSEEFCCSSDNSLSVGFSLISFLQVIVCKIGAISFNGGSHYPDYPSCVCISSFGYSEMCFKSSGLFNNWVKTAEAHKFSLIWKSFNINDFSHKVYGALFTDSWDGAKEFYLSFEEFICFFFNKLCYLLSLFKECIKLFYKEFKELLEIRPFISDGGRGEFIEFFRRDSRFSSIFWGKFLSGLEKLLTGSIFDFVSTSEVKEDGEELFREDTAYSFKFREEESEEGSDFGLGFSNGVSNLFFFSHEVFKGIPFINGLVGFLEFILLELKEIGNCVGVLCVRFSRFGISKFGELVKHIRVNYNWIIPQGVKEVKEIFMVDACRFHSNEDIGMGREELSELREARRVHLEGSVFDDGCIDFQGCNKGVLCHINSAILRLVQHVCTSFKGFLEGVKSTLNLNLLLQMSQFCSINLYETKRVQHKLLYEPYSSGKMIYHPLGLYFTNSMHIYKLNLNII